MNVDKEVRLRITVLWHLPGHELPYPFFCIIAVALILALWRLSTSDAAGHVTPSAATRDRYLADEEELSYWDEIDQMTGTQFENFAAALLEKRGWRNVIVVGGPWDGGIDVIARHPDGALYAFQCKRWASNVPVGVVRELLQAVGPAGPYAGYKPGLITTAHLSGHAQLLANSKGVRVRDRSALNRQIIEAYG
jgi:HJR/Mrr/RecB family endonuclease